MSEKDRQRRKCYRQTLVPPLPSLSEEDYLMRLSRSAGLSLPSDGGSIAFPRKPAKAEGKSFNPNSHHHFLVAGKQAGLFAHYAGL
mmetsp:Transcript_45579/g.117839  ORF Transcript_45579/g.117839 Transcript_45579/m.117839 type:complete len:86 (+) Transcript_45579:1-258(+)